MFITWIFIVKPCSNQLMCMVSIKIRCIYLLYCIFNTSDKTSTKCQVLVFCDAVCMYMVSAPFEDLRLYLSMFPPTVMFFCTRWFAYYRSCRRQVLKKSAVSLKTFRVMYNTRHVVIIFTTSCNLPCSTLRRIYSIYLQH